MNAVSSLKETIKGVGFRVFAFCFDCGARLPVKKDRVVLFNLMHGGFEGALTETERELAAYAPLDLVKVDRNDLERGIGSMLRFMTKDAFTMGRAKTIFINNNFFPFGWVHPNKATSVVQVWHGQGAFKKFGLDIPQPEEVRKKEIGANKPLTYVTCSAETIRPIYMSAFGLPASKVITTGNPVSDYFFREENVGEAAVAAKRKAFDAKFPACKDRYLVLYAPTFRDDPEEDQNLLSHLDAPRLKAAIEAGAGRKAALLIRLHPNDSSGREQLEALTEQYEDILDLTDYPDSNELSVLSDVLITDYSSICMNNALLHKPVVFYAYDLDRFEGDRDFYYPYEETVGGPVVKTMDELCDVFAKQDFRTDRLEAFRKLHFGEFDGGATKAMLEQVL